MWRPEMNRGPRSHHGIKGRGAMDWIVTHPKIGPLLSRRGRGRNPSIIRFLTREAAQRRADELNKESEESS